MANFEKMAKTCLNSLKCGRNLAIFAKIAKLPQNLLKFETKICIFYQIWEVRLKVPTNSFLKIHYTWLYLSHNFGTRVATYGTFRPIFFTNLKILLIKMSHFPFFRKLALMYKSWAFRNGITLTSYHAPNLSTLACALSNTVYHILFS